MRVAKTSPDQLRTTKIRQGCRIRDAHVRSRDPPAATSAEQLWARVRARHRGESGAAAARASDSWHDPPHNPTHPTSLRL